MAGDSEHLAPCATVAPSKEAVFGRSRPGPGRLKRSFVLFAMFAMVWAPAGVAVAMLVTGHA
jgi:hypothetical protein